MAPRTVVLADLTDEMGTVWRAVTLTGDGGLVLCGHDLGRGVRSVFGMGEYEFERRLSARETDALGELLTAPTGGDLLAAIAARFPAGSGLEAFLKEHGIDGRLWSRVGD
ncbi:hypothetical protein BN11_4830001 [Nostocoides australiense Ben110]|uniref:Uncharacterized protein n=1 Tax=Nostocoides australiense Ben110 TaxID=1193182 RepID=W6K178_9MICO|nr:hypothetical protein [Tetrasphaera australiensis]CCH74826.1 hypothetical protein BN11_4830001 [Tetrasphaera australiensis Ben110]